MGSGRVPEKGLGEYQKGGIRASAGKVEIRVSTEKVGSGRVPELWDLGEYQKCGIRASTENVGFGQVPEKVGSGRVPEMWDPGEY